jgi:DNA-directed RNA polymerase specialized sigma24 family protein
MPISNEEKILEKLDQILKVLAIQIGAERNMGERVHLLKIAGLDNQTISELLEIPANTVKTFASQQKAKRRK